MTNISAGRQTTVMFFQGGPAALAALRQRYIQDPPPEIDALEVLQETRTSLVLYETERSGVSATDISVWIHEILGPETVARLGKDHHGVTWRILTFRDEMVPAFLAGLEQAGRSLEEVLTRKVPAYELAGLASPTFAQHGPDLAPTEESVVRMAVKLGFFEQPKKCGVADVAKRLSMPVSTTHFHLQRAQAKIMRHALDPPGKVRVSP